jgi:hypothetical protein
LRRSGISSLEVTSPISLPLTVSGMAEVMTYNKEEICKDGNLFITKMMIQIDLKKLQPN